MSGHKETEKARLRNCKLCGKEISPYSPLCRNCGHPQTTPLVIWLLGMFLIMMITFYISMTVFCMCNVQRFRVSSQPPDQQNSGGVRKPYGD